MKLPWRCRWFGHKWSRLGMDGWVYSSDQCFRCGLTKDDLRKLYTDRGEQ